MDMMSWLANVIYNMSRTESFLLSWGLRTFPCAPRPPIRKSLLQYGRRANEPRLLACRPSKSCNWLPDLKKLLESHQESSCVKLFTCIICIAGASLPYTTREVIYGSCTIRILSSQDKHCPLMIEGEVKEGTSKDGTWSHRNWMS